MKFEWTFFYRLRFLNLELEFVDLLTFVLQVTWVDTRSSHVAAYSTSLLGWDIDWRVFTSGDESLEMRVYTSRILEQRLSFDRMRHFILFCLL